MAKAGSTFAFPSMASAEMANQSIPTNIVFQGLTQDQVNAASLALGLPESNDPRRSVRDILDLLVNSLKASGDSLTSYTASRDIEIVDSKSARETYTFEIDMQISLVNPILEVVPIPVAIPDSSVPPIPVAIPDSSVPPIPVAIPDSSVPVAPIGA